MQKRQDRIIYSPSDLTTFMDSSFESWMDRFYLEHPDKVNPDPADESNEILARHGDKHELAYLTVLCDSGKDVGEITARGEIAELNTIAEMKAGREIIYQGTLSCGQFTGRTDFLVRVDGASDLGSYHYEVWDTKLARKPKPYFLIQLCSYAEMLAVVQGKLPDNICIVLGTSEKVSFRTADYIHQFRQLKDSFVQFHLQFDSDQQPEDCTVGTFSRWQTESQRRLEERDDLSLVANIRRTQIKRLVAAGITTQTQLATSAALFPVAKMRPETFTTLQQQARLQIASIQSGKTEYELLCPQPGQGFALLPPENNSDVYFDMEGYPLVEDGLEYLFGVTYIENESADVRSMCFQDWWAHDREQEKQAFERFIDWVYARWQTDPLMHIYHYAAYEVSAVRRLASRHATRIEEVDTLLRNEVFVDLYRIVKQGVCVGEPSYSIKYVEHLYQEKRQGTVAKASDSVVYYDRWLEHPDGPDYRTSTILKDIRDYNEEDCRSTLLLAQWLRQRQQESGIAYAGKVFEANEERANSEAAELERAMLAECASIEDLEERRIHSLLAYLLQYHKREEKPAWWRFYDRQKMTAEELAQELDCLAGLTRSAQPSRAVARSQSYEYKFDPDQETKLRVGDKCSIIDGSTKQKQAEILELDLRQGLVVLKISNRTELPADGFSLAKHDMVRAAAIVDSIYRIALTWQTSRSLPRHLADYLFRREPRITGRPPGTPIVKSCDALQLTSALARMEESTICVQGPPGCGKTYNASQAIVELIRQGKRIGVTSNSHKAIENLLEGIAEAANQLGVPFVGANVGGTAPVDNQGYGRFGVYDALDDSSALFRKGAENYHVIGGTAWLFSRPECEGLLDYLFVDEAGQVCIANLVAMSPSTSNVVLLGDQMQLEQPVQGTHPDEVGYSALQYLLGDSATIADHFGIFLGSTHRMHPNICKLISSAVYENRLQPEPGNQRQVLLVPPTLEQRFSKNAGVLWIPVEHEGNSQESLEEVLAIKDLVNDLLRCQIVEKHDVTRDVRLNDILIVSPFNMQVKAISEHIPDALVASVDKFQGWQRAIVILTMCASDGNSSPRGMDFLFSKSRLNVAISRATTMAFAVGSPTLLKTKCSSIQQMKLLNFFCQIVDCGLQPPDPVLLALV